MCWNGNIWALATDWGLATNIWGLATSIWGLATTIWGLAANGGLATNVCGLATSGGLATNICGLATSGGALPLELGMPHQALWNTSCALLSNHGKNTKNGDNNFTL